MHPALMHAIETSNTISYRDNLPVDEHLLASTPSATPFMKLR